MAISPTLKNYLAQHNVDYTLLPHPHTGSSMETAEAAHVPGGALAKAVVMKGDDKRVMVVIPSNLHVDVAEFRRRVGHGFELATESDITDAFPDCAVGAVPPIGPAWGIDAYLDEGLLEHEEIFFEAGDHEELVRLKVSDFENLLGDAERGRFGNTI